MLITFFTWLTVSIFSTQTTLQVIQTQGNERAVMQEKIYNKVEDNSKILSNKLDVDEYLIKHKELENKIDMIQTKVDKIYNKKLFYSNYMDTLFMPVWEPNSLTKNNN